MQGKILNNRYKIIKEIGRGGMAIVYSAKDTLLERIVALKMLRPEYNSDKEFIDKFRQEARAVAKLSHPNVVSIYDIVVDEERLYLVMEIVEGKNLKDLIKARKKLSIAESLKIAGEIAAALSVAHGNKIVHCDIKPHNIILTEDMEVKVTDFGIARAISQATTRVTETVVGSAHYFSPEQAKGGNIKAYSDVYSLGVVLYEMTAGELPFHGESPISVALKHIQQQPVEPIKINNEIPQAVNDLIMKAIAKDPSDRFENAQVMRREIIYCLKNLKISGNKTKKIKSFDPDETKIMKKSDFKFGTGTKNNSSSKKSKDIIAKNSKDKNNEKNNEKTAPHMETSSAEAAEENNNIIIDEDQENNKKEQKNKLENPNSSLNSEKENLFGKETDIEKNKSNKIKRAFYLSAIVLIFFLVSGFLVSFFFKQYTGVAVVDVPNIEGKSLKEAQKLLSEVGLNLLENEERIFNEEIPENHIITQYPEGDERIKQSRPINVTVSKGAELIKIPELKGFSLREALIELDNLNLKSSDIQYIFRLSEEPGTVINQIPAAGAQVAKKSEVTLFVSRGERDISIRMPDLTGLTQEEAFELLRSKNLNIGQVEIKNSSRFADGQVISQSIKAGEYLPRGIEVDFVISKGSENNGDGNTRLNRISVNVTGTESKEIRIVVEDNNGKDQIYRALHEPGDNIIRDIKSQGKTEVRIYFDDQLIKSESFGG